MKTMASEQLLYELGNIIRVVNKCQKCGRRQPCGERPSRCNGPYLGGMTVDEPRRDGEGA